MTMLQKKHLSTPVLIVALATTQAPAAELQFDQEGVVGLALQSQGSHQETLLFGEFDLGLAYGAATANLGAFGRVGRQHETYVTLGWRTQNGHFELGVPKPAYDRFAVSADFAHMPQRALENVGLTRSRATEGALEQSDYLPIGLSYVGSAKGLNYAASVHHTSSQDETVLGLGASYEADLAVFEIGLEYANSSATNALNAKAKVSKQLQNTQIAGAIFVSDANQNGTTVEVSAQHSLTDEVLLSGFYQHVFDTDQDVAGASLSYTTPTNTQLQASVLQEDRDTFLGLTLSQRF